MRLPVWPTWSAWGRQPLLVTTRGAADRAAEQLGQLLDRGEALRRADAPAAADDDRRASVSVMPAAACTRSTMRVRRGLGPSSG